MIFFTLFNFKNIFLLMLNVNTFLPFVSPQGGFRCPTDVNLICSGALFFMRQIPSEPKRN